MVVVQVGVMFLDDKEKQSGETQGKVDDEVNELSPLPPLSYTTLIYPFNHLILTDNPPLPPPPLSISLSLTRCGCCWVTATAVPRSC